MSRDEEILGFIRALMHGFLDDFDEAKVTRDARLDELGVASLDLIEMQVELKRRYAVELPTTLFTEGQVQTVGDLVARVVAQLQAA